MKTLAFVITTSPLAQQSKTAFDLVKASCENQAIKVLGVFFYQDGVSHANQNIQLPSDEWQAIKAWQTLQQEYSLPLHLCISAAEKRGMSEETNNINVEFQISGLGELVELSQKADRVIQL